MCSLRSALMPALQLPLMAGLAKPGGLATCPATARHALGETEISAKPDHLARTGWFPEQASLALGIIPVGLAAAKLGDDGGDDLLPWVSGRLKAHGAQAPVLFAAGDGWPCLRS